MDPSPRTETVRFGVYDFDLRARELRKQGVRVALQDKPFEVLALLLERPGEVVTRDEIQRRLWPGDTFVVFDDNVNTAVKKVRDALGDTPDGSRFIQTVPRHGYKFIGPVDRNGGVLVDERLATPAPAAPITKSTRDQSGPSLRMRPVLAQARQWHGPSLLFVAGVLAGLAMTLIRRSPEKPPLMQIAELTFSGSDSEPAAAPDGTILAFTSSRDGVARIWLKQLQTGGERPITGGADRRPRFFAGGASLVFIRSAADADSAWRIPLVGGAPRQILADVVEADPSPIDDRMAFVRFGHNDGAQTTLGVIDRDGAPGRPLLTLSNAELTCLRWSPDGRTIAAIRRSSGGTDTAIVVVDTQTGASREIRGTGPGAFGALAWNGDSRSLVVTRSANSKVNMPGTLDSVQQYDVRSDGSHTLFFEANLFGPFRSVGNNGRLDVLSTGTLVFHTVETKATLREVAVGATAGASALASTSGNAQDRQPVYSPDGASIVFTSNRSGNYDLWRLTRATGALEQLTDDPAQDRDPAFSSSGRLLWSSDSGGHFEIWISNMDHTGLRQISHDGFGAENPTMGRASPWIIYASRNNAAKEGLWRVREDGSGASRIVAGDFSLPEASPTGRYALYREDVRARQRSTIHVVQIEDARVVPFEIVVSYQGLQSVENLAWGRARWTIDGKALVFLAPDELGHAAVFRQDFIPGQDTSGSRRQIFDSLNGSATESFGLSLDGQRMVVADAISAQSLHRAVGVPGVLGRR